MFFLDFWNFAIHWRGIDWQKEYRQCRSQVASAENAQTTDTDTATSKENLSVTPAEGSSSVPSVPSVPIRSTPETSDQTAPAEWGERHDDLANSGSKGVAELRKRKSGWIPNAWVRDDIGGIALPYGKTDAEVKAENKGRKTGYGLAHIDEGHPDLDWDLADDAIRNGKITDKSGNRIILEHTSNDQKHRVVVQIDFDQISQNWLVTVYKKVAESPANPLTTAHDNKGVADNITPENSTDNTIPQSAEKSSADPEKIIDKITSAEAGSRDRIMAFTELPDGEHTVNGKSFTKSGNAFTLDGKTLNAKEIEKATRTTSEKMRKTVDKTVSDAKIADTPKAEAKPEDKPTLSDKMRGKGKKDTAVPSAEKSAPEKTDESGNTVLFSLIGDRGAARMENAEILLDNLRIAREMTADGKDAKTIKLATGWEKGKDGKWRMEIPDLKVKEGFVLSDGSLSKFEAPVFFDDVLSDIVESPELFSAYPELKNIRVKMSSYLKAFAAWSEQDKTIYLNTDKFYRLSEQEQKRLEKAKRQISDVNNWDDKKQKSYAMLRLETDPKKIEANAKKEIKEITQLQLDRIKESLIHEIQHAIQDIEGFAPGGSMDTDVRESQDPVLQRHINKANELITEKEKLEKQLKELKKSPEANEKQISSVKHRIARIEELLDTNRINAESSTSPQSTYKRLAGEVESRNAVTRSKMSMDERRRSLIDETADVAPEDRIYLMENAGVSELAVDTDGNQLFNVQNHGQMTITDIINDKNISAETEILTDSGNNIWGKITEEMAKAGQNFGLEALPIKLLKGNHGFGIVHIYKHLSDFPNQDLARLMELVFGDINKIYARDEAGNIKLEIFPPKARYYGILELRKQDGYYSVVSFFTRKSQHEKPKGKLIWVRSSQSATSQATNNQPKNEISEKMLQENQAELTAQTSDNINPLQAEVNPASSKNPENSSGGVQFSMPSDLGDTSLSPIDYRRSVDPLFDFFMEQSDNGKLNPGSDHIGEDFTGSFIADEYKTYSIKRKQGKNETDASYQKYLANREQKLKNAQGITLDELAAKVFGSTLLPIDPDNLSFCCRR